MKVTERKSMWHHAVFSSLMCVAIIAIVITKHDLNGLLIALFIAFYIGGNTLIHYRRKDFSKETLYEYLLVSAAVIIVLVGAMRH